MRTRGFKSFTSYMRNRLGFAWRVAWALALSVVLATGGILFGDSGQPKNRQKLPSQDPLIHLRIQVKSVADSALPTWIHQIPIEQLHKYGFDSKEEAGRSKVQQPIPFFSPPRARDKLIRQEIESAVEGRPLTWIVPVALNGQIRCLLIIDALDGHLPEVVEFGKTFAANRLNAGIRALDLYGKDWGGLRFLSFVDPTVDLLLFRNVNKTWKWLRLLGTEEGRAIELGHNEITPLLASLVR